MAKLVIVTVPATREIPQHTVQMLPEEAARFWEEQERRFQVAQVRYAAKRDDTRILPPGSGARVAGNDPAMVGALRSMGLPVDEEIECHGIPFERTLFLAPTASLRLELVPAGLRFLDRWSVAVPLWSYTELARDIGTEEERTYTAATIHDLRVPLYDPRVLFVRRVEEAEKLLAAWEVETAYRGEDRLAFLRALYKVKPLFLALPTTWINGK